MTELTAGVTEVVAVAGQCFTIITANPIAMVFVAFSVVGGGFAIVRKIFHTGR